MHPLIVSGLALVGCAVGFALPAQSLVKDFNTAPSPEDGSSFPGSFRPLPGGRSLFTMATPWQGGELWTTDGTVAGTTMVVDLQPGPSGSGIQQITELSPGVFLFTAVTLDHGWELWRTDGTAAGTSLVKDIRPGPESSVAVQLTRFGNQVVFFANDGVHGVEPWISDGTPSGTVLLADLSPGPGSMSNGTAEIAALGTGEFVFTVLPPTLVWELWRSDGTPAGTTALRSFPVDYIFGPSRLRAFGNKVLFEARDVGTSDELWVTDGTTAGTLSLGVYWNAGLQVVGGVAYFRGWSQSTAYELWRTDGTPAGTSLVIDLVPGGSFSGSGDPWLVGELQGDVLFFSYSPSGRGLFRSDGTAAGTTWIANVANYGTYYGDDWGTEVNGELWFRVQSGTVANGLYRTDGTTAGTTLVTSLSTNGIAAVGSTVVMSGDDGSQVGVELYTTDGTPAGTQLLLDATPAPVSLAGSPVPLAMFRDRAVVQATTVTEGRELWLTDGTTVGTTLLADLEPGPASFALAGVAAGDRRIMICGQVSGADGDPWFSDGTPAGTAQSDWFPAAAGFSAHSPAAFGERFVFAGRLPPDGEEPWITDGTAAGTYRLADIAPGTSHASPRAWRRFGDRMLFSAYDFATSAAALWSTDGTTAGTVQLAQLSAPFLGFSSWSSIEFGGRLWFVGYSAANGFELWSTDGTPAGTALELDLVPGPDSWRPGAMAIASGRLLVVVASASQSQLVSTDGTPAGTVVLGLPPLGIVALQGLDAGHAAFLLQDPVAMRSWLWRTDGTAAGTTQVREVGLLGAYVESAKPGAERWLFTPNEPGLGVELWSTDGTVAGTFLVGDVAPGSSYPRFITRVGERVIFAADDGVHGVELFAVDLAADVQDWAKQTFGSGCSAAGQPAPEALLTGPARVSAGAPFSFQLTGGAPSSVAVLAWGTRRAAVDIPGCTLWIEPIDFLALPTDSFGAAALPVLPVPPMIGARLDTQWFVLDPAGPVFGFATSSGGLEVVVGP